MLNIKKRKTTLTETESRLVVARGGRIWKMGEGGQRVQNSSYTMSKSWGSNIQHGDDS